MFSMQRDLRSSGAAHAQRAARALLLPGLLASCVAGSEGPHDSGSPTGPQPGLTADLFAGPIEVPDHIAVDSVLEMDIAVRNGGSGVVDAGWILRVVLSTDKLIDSADIQIDHFSAPRLLQPGAEDHYIRHKKLRASTPTGLYYVGSILDVTGAVSEGSETNNTLQSPTPITLTAKDAGSSGGDD